MSTSWVSTFHVGACLQAAASLNWFAAEPAVIRHGLGWFSAGPAFAIARPPAPLAAPSIFRREAIAPLCISNEISVVTLPGMETRGQICGPGQAHASKDARIKP